MSVSAVNVNPLIAKDMKNGNLLCMICNTQVVAMSVSAVNVNPLIAKDMKNGNLLCMICNTQVKSKIWTAHSNGRKHRENIELLKKRHAARQIVSKRPAPEEHPQPSSSVPIKKPREERVEEEVNANFTPAQTPWQRGTKNVENRLKRPIPKNVIEGVPEGFFDDEKLNNRIDHWKRVNRLELRRDEIYKLSMKETEITRILKDEEVMSDDDSVDLDNPCNWRSKGI
uniref:U1-type domain-containing protein n=1 Tax=Ascaris lumbricoides TaxID=6252 RepID=A0A0M3I4V2_ASCLU